MEAQAVPLPQEGSSASFCLSIGNHHGDSQAEDDELLVDAPPVAVNERDAAQIEQRARNDAEMHIDEEGRPRFAPAKNTVSFGNTLKNQYQLKEPLGRTLSCGDPQSSYPASSYDATQSLVAKDLSSSRRTSQVTSTNEYKEPSH